MVITVPSCLVLSVLIAPLRFCYNEVKAHVLYVDILSHSLLIYNNHIFSSRKTLLCFQYLCVYVCVYIYTHVLGIGKCIQGFGWEIWRKENT